MAWVPALRPKVRNPGRCRAQPDGQPDLQGIWSNAKQSPLERPKQLGAKEFYTEQEAADDCKEGIPGRPRNTLPEAHYDISQYGHGSDAGKASRGIFERQ